MKVIAYDLGTGGVKASLYNEKMETLAKSFVEYSTNYAGRLHEQNIEDWWNGVATSTRKLLADSSTSADEVRAVALSGHSLVSIPLDTNNRPLEMHVPIWSDGRAVDETQEFFKSIPYEEWYMTTGNGFPPECYPVFKLMWLKKHKREIYDKTCKVAGSKDYINLLLTGNLCTDYSYASGSGVYDLRKQMYRKDFLRVANLKEDLFPQIVESHSIVGYITDEAAKFIGLKSGTAVACGGVDNGCMALGAVGAEEKKIYLSLGSSSWVPVNSRKPVLDFKTKPYVFAHIEKDMYTSAYSIFAGGSSHRWIKDVISDGNTRDYEWLNAQAAMSPVGANGVIFNPSLAGGTTQDRSVNIKGGFIGLTLGVKQEDLIRAVMEGVALNLKYSVDLLSQQTEISDEILICGGGSKSDLWLSIFADVFNMKIRKTNVDQDAASLGAAAIAMRSIGLWQDYHLIPHLHKLEKLTLPNKENTEKYKKIQKKFLKVADMLAQLGDEFVEIDNQ